MATYIIIGASSGIGLALAQQLSGEGHHVIGTYRNTPPPGNTQIEFYALDVLTEMPDFSFLPKVIDGLAYCPGLVNLKPFTRITPAQFAEDYLLQVVGAVKCLQAALPALKAAPQSAIVLFSTVAVQTGFNFHSLVSASKGAVEGLTRALAAELAPKIRVNTIAPSITDTPLVNALMNSPEKREGHAQRHPLKRVATAQDVAHVAQFLLTEQSSLMTGQILQADGGISAVRL
jgi:NAD(P)-dependent dehydrogenase (short-subunit alcohol dehydrogenase family)